MKKIRDGISGEVNAEIFETWFPDNPTKILKWFLGTDLVELKLVIPQGEEFIVSRITRDYAQGLLDEFKDR